MNKKIDFQTFLERQKDYLNEFSDDSSFYDEIQTGPMEEGTLMEFKYDRKQFKKYLKKINDKQKTYK